MYITCLDLEGVLVPEIWIDFAKASSIPELTRTTRDEPDYDKLMKWRLGILKEHGLGIREIQDVIASIEPLPGAKEFLDELRSFFPGHHYQRYFYPVCRSINGKAGPAYHFLQLPGNS